MDVQKGDGMIIEGLHWKLSPKIHCGSRDCYCVVVVTNGLLGKALTIQLGLHIGFYAIFFQQPEHLADCFPPGFHELW